MAESDIQKGTRFITVPDTAFAAALVAMGVPFVDYGDPCRYMETEGQTSVVWNMSPDGALSNTELVAIAKALKNPEQWLKDNPEHPFGYALAAIMNYKQMQELVDSLQPLVKFKFKTGATFIIRKGTEKYEKLIAKGFKPL
jgi:hypothetical protein